MSKEKIYIVISYGGQYEDKWDTELRAYTSKEDAEKFAQEYEDKYNIISDEEFLEIRDYIYDKVFDLQMEYYEEDYQTLREGKTEEEWFKAEQEFDKKTKYQLIMEEFGYTKEQFDEKEDMYDWDFSGCRIKELDLYKK